MVFTLFSLFSLGSLHAGGTFTPAYGTTTASDFTNNVLIPKFKIQYGADGSATDVSAVNPFPITVVSTPFISNYALESGGHIQAIDLTLSTQLDVLLSTRASESTLSLFKTANHTDLLGVQTRLDTSNANLGTANSNLVTIQGKQDTGNASLSSIDAKLTSPLSVAQSGVWTTGRTWSLLNTTDSVNAVQAGVWNINNISGTISLPTGAATAANQATANASLSSIDSKLTSPIAVSQSGFWDVRNITGSVSLPANAAQETGGHLAQIDADLDVALSTRASAANQTNGSQKAQQVDAAGAVVGPVQVNGGVNHLPVYLPLDVASGTQNITTQDIGSVTTTGYANQSFILGTPTVGSVATLTVNSIQTVMAEIKGIWTGTLAIEVSSDSGSTWVPRGVHVVGTAIFSSSVTANVLGSLNASAKTNVRVRATTAMTGTAQVSFLVSDNPSNIYVANPVKLVDSSSTTSNTQMNIKAASTAAVATDTSIVVALNPGTPLNLPTGASTAALQTTGNSSLSSIDTDIDVALSTRASLANQTNGTQKSQVVDGSGNVQPSGDVAARALFVKATDGTNTAAVKAASTPAAATDPAIVVTMSPNAAFASPALTANAPAAASVGVASAQAVAVNASRKGLILVNTSNKTISCGFGSAAVLNSGLTLFPGGAYNMTSFDINGSAVNCIASGAASNLSIQEYQ